MVLVLQAPPPEKSTWRSTWRKALLVLARRCGFLAIAVGFTFLLIPVFYFVNKWRPSHLSGGINCCEGRQAPVKDQAPAFQIPATDIAVGMIVSGREPYRGRATASQATWAVYFAASYAFSFENVTGMPWVETVPALDPREMRGQATGLRLAVIPLLLNRSREAKWFLVVDDDTFVVPHHIREVALSMDHRKPVLAGRCRTYPEEKKTEYITGGSGILISRAFAEAVAEKVPDCRRKFAWHQFGDTRVTSCGREVFRHTRSFISCKQSQFWNGNVWEVDRPSSKLPMTGRVATMHIKTPTLFYVLFRYFERSIAQGRQITWRDVARTLDVLRSASP